MPAPLDLKPVSSPQAPVTSQPASPDRQRATGNRELVWEAPEYVVQEKTPLWYAAFGVVMALLLFAAFLLRSFLSGVVFVLLGLLVLLYSERPPRRVRFQLTRDALLIDDRQLRYRDLEVFNLVESVHGPLLLIRARRLFVPLIHVPLADQDPETVRRVLRRGVKEDPDLRESLADLLAHRLGF